MKLWIDDIRTAPEGYTWCKTVKSAIDTIIFNRNIIEVIDIDNDAGDYAFDGGDYIKVLNWLEYMGYNYPIHIHTMNPVARRNMEQICRKNNWTIL